MSDYEYELDGSELDTPKPYTPEQQEMIDEMNAELAAAFDEYCELCKM